MPGDRGGKIFEESRLNFGHDKLYLKVSINPDKPTRLIEFHIYSKYGQAIYCSMPFFSK
jgi:hypothetical protein